MIPAAAELLSYRVDNNGRWYERAIRKVPISGGTAHARPVDTDEISFGSVEFEPVQTTMSRRTMMPP
jgi:hypothetical protein